MSHFYDFRDLLARSTDKSFDDTDLARVLVALPIVTPAGPWLAGGALRRTMMGGKPDSDFDFFFRDADQLETFRLALEARGFVKIKETEHHMHYRGGIEGKAVDVQAIRFAFYENAGTVIDSFDFTICQFAFDGVTLTVGEHALWDLGRRRLTVNKITFPVSSARRMIKYTQQGFVACNGCLTALLRSTRDNPELRLDIKYID